MESANKNVVTMDDIKSSSHRVYKDFFVNNPLVKQWVDDGNVFKTRWHGEDSKNSFCLISADKYRGHISQTLIDRFEITDKELFKEKYLEAISGDGQEWTRITTLHSSSLLALLCFYSVDAHHVLRIGGYTFDDSYFEVKTQVYENAESNMDVVLRGRDEKGQQVALFLECKFSEYLNCGNCNGISFNAYNSQYEALGLFDNQIIGIEFKKGCTADPRRSISICSINGSVYCEGIKQMLSHYMGVSNYHRYRANALAEHRRFVQDENEQILLGEILFDFGDDVKGAANKFKNYSQAYADLARIINGKGPIKMLDGIITYQSILKDGFIFENRIKQFYGFK